MTIRLLPDADADWAVEVWREREEVLVNPGALGLADVADPIVRECIVAVGTALLHHLAEHPGTSDEELLVVALAARRDATG